MNLLFQIIAVSLNLLLFIKIFRKLKHELKVIYVVLLIFQAIFVIPIALEWMLGIQEISYKSPGFQKALNDTQTNIIYNIIIIIISLVLYVYGIKARNKGVVLGDIKTSLGNLKITRGLYGISVVLMFTPLICILFSPSPDKYLMNYAYFQRFRDLATESELWYHGNILRISAFISLIFILITKLFSSNNWVNNFIIYLAAISTGILNGKRTLFAFVIFGILSVDILKYPEGKFPVKKVVLSGLSIVLVFIGYAFLINKHTMNVSTIDNLRLYFFRDIDLKFSIYALLNPKEYKILDFRGQSYLFNTLFYIPRQFWENKPYPYDIYVTASALGYPPGTVLPWSFQTSFFGEALSNLGWFGIPFSLLVINQFIKISEKSGNSIIIILCLFIITFSFMNHFGAYRNYFAIWILLIIINRFKGNKYQVKN